MTTRLVGAIVAMLVLAGCTSAGSWSEARVEPPAGTPSSAGSSAGSSAEPTAPSASEEPSASDAPSAADGTDVAACRDGRCEVLIRGRVVVPLDPRFGFAAMTVTFVPPDRTLFAANDTQGGTFQGEIGGMGQLGANDITVEVVDLGPAGVVLRFAPRS